jgi:hypothetical protein
VGTCIFEELCREWVLRQGDAGRLPFVPRRIRSLWGSRQPQTDLLTVNEDDHAILLAECKWTREPIRKRMVAELQERARQVIPEPVDRWQVRYAFFFMSGFTNEARQAATGNFLWLTLDRLDRELREV